LNLEENTIASPKGYRAAGVAAGLKPQGRDLALIVSDRPASAAGMFTTNRVQAPAVQLNRERLQDGRARAIVANSKNANACTGAQGHADARRTAQVVAAGLGYPPEDVLVNSTGVIGVPLPMDRIEAGIASAVSELREDGWEDAARAIMTTDTVPKMATVRLQLSGRDVVLSGIAKGSGMIAPNLATMLSFVATDAAVAPDALRSCLAEAVARSFNCVTVDGDMSTSDTVLVLANGASGGGPIEGDDLGAFRDGLTQICTSLARQIARDGEGATKLITIRVTGAPCETQARTVGLSVANSNLVKTAVFGRDPNWGRILCAVGYSGAPVDPNRISVAMAGIPIFNRGEGVPFEREQAIESLSAPEITIDVDLGSGDAGATIYTCDLTYDYVKINAEYTT
jgi:glutamate N-acetyltransferase/amino-acid N-acetyltransferase